MRSDSRGDGSDDPIENERLAASRGAADPTVADIDRVITPFPQRPVKSRMTAFVILLLGCTALASGWALAMVFQSSAQRDAATTPPAPSPILATVSTGNLVRQTAFSGSIIAENEEALSLAVPNGARRSVITGHSVAQGSTMNTGQILTEVNGRPVFVVKSAFPFYRDVGRGDQGPDVTAIQETLRYLGYSLAADGEFGAQTEMAVRDWYSKNGYTVATRDVDIDDASIASRSGASQEGPRADSDSVATRATSTAFVPYSEVIGVKTLPSASLTALAVGTAVGADGETDIVLGSTTTRVSFEAAPADLAHLDQGSEVSLEIDGLVSTGVVSSIAPIQPGAQDEPADDQPEDAETQGRSAVTVIPSEPIEASRAKVRVVSSQVIVDQEALLVPSIAVIDRGDTNQVVVVRRRGGEFTEVAVTVLGALDGRSAISPSSPSSIQDGDQVRVGIS